MVTFHWLMGQLYPAYMIRRLGKAEIGGTLVNLLKTI